MPTISSKISKKELDAIQEYANACGDTVSNVIRKTILNQAVFSYFYGDTKEYNCWYDIPENLSGDEENQFLLEKINRIRRILGMQEQEEI